MSVLVCERCSKYIDTDYHPETYREELDQWLCEPCYEEETDTLEEYDLHHGGLQQRKEIVE